MLHDGCAYLQQMPDVPSRMAWKSKRRVSSVTWRLDTAAAAFGLRGRGSDRGTACRRSNFALPLRHFRKAALGESKDVTII